MRQRAAARLRAALGAQFRASAAVSGLMLVVAFALKRSYSTAGADALAFILAPSCWLAAHLGGLTLAPEPGAGYISHSPRMVVGPACAGVNFLTVAWLAFYFCAQANFVGAWRKLAWLCGCGLAAYLATVASNGVRIALAAQLFGADVYAFGLTKARAHCMLGVVLYCGTLLLACRAIERCAQATADRRRPGARLSPLFWYVAVVLLVPLAHRAWVHDPSRFAEHAALTLGACAAVAGCGRLLGTLLDRLHSGRARS